MLAHPPPSVRVPPWKVHRQCRPCLTAQRLVLPPPPIQGFHSLPRCEGGFRQRRVPLTPLSPLQKGGQPVLGLVGRFFPQGPYLPPDVPGIPPLFRPCLSWGPSRIPHLPPPVRHIRLLPPPGDSQVTDYLLRRRLCCHGGLTLLQNQRSPPSEVLLCA